MGETSLNLVGGEPHAGSGAAAVTFLCHNSVDKPFVKQIADALEIEFGTRFFLDAYAIPTGEAFLPWIERSLAEASGVAIFLGGNGWGPTHLWEAERALSRYRDDPAFKLIPVALPGIAASEMRRLGAGKVFQEINWADFTTGPRDLDSLAKLEAALSGRALPQHRGPARLTPYQIRRDAMRWTEAKGKDRSIFYKGAQLDQAFDVLQVNPDYAVSDEVIPFLNAARAHQRRFWRRAALAGTTAAVAFAALSVGIYLNYGLAERRRIASLSRQLAIASREAPGADRRLLIAARAVLTDRTAEAKGALLESLEEWRHLRRTNHLAAAVNALASPDRPGAVLVGTEDGSLLNVGARIAVPAMPSRPGGRSVTALVAALVSGTRYVGRRDGRVEAVSGEAIVTLLDPPAEPPRQRDLSVRSLAITSDGSLLAAGTGSGRLAVIDARLGKVVRELDEGEAVAVTALTFSPDGARLAAGTSRGELVLFNAGGEERQRYPRLDGGVLAAEFGPDGTLRVVTGYGFLVTFADDGGEFRRIASRHLGGMITVAAFDRSGARMATGDAYGSVRVMHGDGEPTGFAEVGAHAGPVSALAFAADGTLSSGSSDGTLAAWDFTDGGRPSRPMPDFGPSLDLLRVRPDGTLMAALATKGKAGVWRLDAGRWVQEADLLAMTRESLGPSGLVRTADPPAPGFESLDAEIVALAMDASGKRIAWTTASGALLWLELEGSRRVNVLGATADEASGLGMSPDGRWIAVLAPGRTRIEVIDLRAGDADRRGAELPAPGTSLAFDPRGGRIVVGLDDGRLAELRSADGWRVDAGTEPRHGSAVAGVGFTPDGGTLVTFGSGGGGTDRSLVVTDAERSSPPRRLQSRLPGGSVAAMAIGTKAGVLAAADQSGQVLLWDLADLRFMAAVTAGTTSVTALGLDEGRGTMITYSGDGSFRAWDLDVDAWIRLACAKANRDLRPDEWAELLPDDPMESTCGAKPG